MRTVVTETKVYTYDELSDKAKEKVKQWLLDDELRGETLLEIMEQDLYHLFGTKLKVQFSLSCCQGDGVNIYGDVGAEKILQMINGGNLGELSKKFKDYLTEKEQRTILAYADICPLISLPENRRYCYSLADRIDFSNDWIYELERACYKNINEAVILIFEKMVQDIFGEICCEYETMGYKYLYEMDDEEAKETCTANGYEFTADGRWF